MHVVASVEASFKNVRFPKEKWALRIFFGLGFGTAWAGLFIDLRLLGRFFGLRGRLL